jgi:DNA (cytosine-5)-methyltransferase 1
MTELTFLEFFAGGGMARIGLGPDWRCIFANDRDAKKCAAYRENFGSDELIEADAEALTITALPAVKADLAWASFPCQDLSLAGRRAGLAGARSGAFFHFHRFIDELAHARRAPRTIVVENVTGLLTSARGSDFSEVVAAFAGAGYRVSALVLNASAFVPQSRPRLFIFAFGPDCRLEWCGRPEAMEFTPRALLDAVDALPPEASRAWRWLKPRPRTTRNADLVDIIDDGVWNEEAGERALAQMSGRQYAAVETLLAAKSTRVGAGFRRMRQEDGAKVQRFEGRFDGLAGCLRTPKGGSSRQILFKIESGRAFARLLGPREAARLMGLPENYKLPQSTTAALELVGDGVAPPVVRWIAEEILQPALRRSAAEAA